MSCGARILTVGAGGGRSGSGSRPVGYTRTEIGPGAQGFEGRLIGFIAGGLVEHGPIPGEAVSLQRS